MISYYKTIDGLLTKIDNYEDGCWVNAIAPDNEEIQILKDSIRDRDFDSWKV